MKVTREEFEFMLGAVPEMHRASPGERRGGSYRPTAGGRSRRPEGPPCKSPGSGSGRG